MRSAGCRGYSDPEVQKFIESSFTPARFHVKDGGDAFARFGAQWTPTILIASTAGKEHHRIEGFLPKEDFMAQLRLGLAHLARETGDFAAAEKRYREVSDSATPELAAEAIYWAGVSKYKASNDAAALAETARQLREHYPGSTWMKKASVWET